MAGFWGHHVTLYIPFFSSYGLKVDIWAAGVITYILLCGFPPFRRSVSGRALSVDSAPWTEGCHTMTGIGASVCSVSMSVPHLIFASPRLT